MWWNVWDGIIITEPSHVVYTRASPLKGQRPWSWRAVRDYVQIPWFVQSTNHPSKNYRDCSTVAVTTDEKLPLPCQEVHWQVSQQIHGCRLESWISTIV